MKLPRWTAYVALGVLGASLVTAIPKRVERPAAGAAEAARAGSDVQPEYPRVVVLGIDGLDPEILGDVIERFPGRMPNFEKLIGEGSGIRELGTSTPPQSPVAWSNFITGRNPGGHGVYDFIHADREHYTPVPGTVKIGEAGAIALPGRWKFPTGGASDSNRSGKAFWTILGENGVPADVWRMPINFPVEPSKKGLSFPGMMTPAVDSAYGEPSLYSTDPPIDSLDDEKVIQVAVRDGVVRTHLLGPGNGFMDGDPRAKVSMEIYVDEEAQAAVVDIDDGAATVVLEPGEWSDFVPVTFDMLPLGMMGMNGIVRFYLRSVSPELELYASPVNVDPKAPINPVSLPESAAATLAEAIGPYYTQGMAEDVNGLKKRMLTDAEFVRQAMLVYEERNEMLDFALDTYMQDEEGGLLFFYYSTIDLCCHMMWRHADRAHPFYDEAVAGQDSSWFSGRPGSTLHDVVADLYMKMDPVLGKIRERVGEDTLVIVMSDHGFAPYRRKFSLNTWLLEEGYLVLREGRTREVPKGQPGYGPVNIFGEGVVDWEKTRAYGMGFNALYLNRAGREAHGVVTDAQAPALVAELRAKLEAVEDPEHPGTRVVLAAVPASEAYHGERLAEAPDLVVGYNEGYGNSDEASMGRIPAHVLSDNVGGTFNGSHLMDPSVVNGVLITNGSLALSDPRLEDLTVEILRRYGIAPDGSMGGRPVLQ